MHVCVMSNPDFDSPLCIMCEAFVRRGRGSNSQGWSWRLKGVPCPSLRQTAISIVAAVRRPLPAGGSNPGHSLDSGPLAPWTQGNPETPKGWINKKSTFRYEC